MSAFPSQVLDDVFTKAAEAAESEQKALEEQREQLEKALMEKAPPRRARTPEEMEDKMGRKGGREEWRKRGMTY